MRLSVRDGVAVIDVRDPFLWARDPRTARFYDQLSERAIGEVYDDVKREFWEGIAPDIADEHGFGDVVNSHGRSGGWLGVGAQWWTSYIDPDADPNLMTAEERSEPDMVTALAAREQWLKFAHAIDEAVEAACDCFTERLAERAAADDHIVKGYN
jgi:hypothetical protein